MVPCKVPRPQNVINTLSSYANTGVRVDETSVLSIFNELDAISGYQKESDRLLDYIDKYYIKFELKSVDTQRLRRIYNDLSILKSLSVKHQIFGLISQNITQMDVSPPTKPFVNTMRSSLVWM